ncbi:unnamed protein product [Rhizophagus irregularis]|nr:unnamed protein product [Rhizophagus irregularis]
MQRQPQFQSKKTCIYSSGIRSYSTINIASFSNNIANNIAGSSNNIASTHDSSPPPIKWRYSFTEVEMCCG